MREIGPPLWRRLVLGVAALAVGASASPVPVLLEPARGTSAIREADGDWVVRRRAVDVNMAALRSRGASGEAEIRFDLFDGRHLDAVLDQAVIRSEASFSWFGHPAGGREGTVSLAAEGEVLHANIRLEGGESYRVRWLGRGLHELQQIDEEALPGCGLDESHVIRSAIDAELAGVPPPEHDDGTRFDVLVVYSEQAVNGEGGPAAMSALINLAIDETNVAYQQSLITPRVRLVHQGPAGYSESGDFDTDLVRFTNTADGHMDSVHATRNSVGADLCVLLVNSTQYCGLAWLMTTLSGGFASSAFSVTSRVCATGNYTFAHEMGHNMGCAHDRDNATVALYPYSYGHRFNGTNGTQYRTVMAYAPGLRIQRFSNPNVSYQGTPTGVAAGTSGQASNALSINNARNTVANWRQERAQTPGDVLFDRDAYSCSGTIGINLGDADLIGTGSNAVLVTTSGGDSEIVVVTETQPGTFQGTIGLAAGGAVPSSGAVEVLEGQTVTVTYNDASGTGGVPGVDTDDAAVDCTPPAIADIHIANNFGVSASVRFTTDSPATSVVRHGAVCEATGLTASGPRTTGHAVTLTDLTPNTLYHFRLEATDDAGNVAVDDNGGVCHTFITGDTVDFLTELFSDSDNDLMGAGGVTFTFTPDGSSSHYAVTRTLTAAFPTDPAGGTPVSLGDDASAAVNLGEGQMVSLFGVPYASFHIVSNGHLCFGSVDTARLESLASHFARPRISALFDDLNPLLGGSISWRQLGDRVAVTYDSIRQYGASDSNTFQIELLFDGRLTITYLSLGAADGLVGLSRGTGLPPGFAESDFSAYPLFVPGPAGLLSR